jgi:hypothetical protein
MNCRADEDFTHVQVVNAPIAHEQPKGELQAGLAKMMKTMPVAMTAMLNPIPWKTRAQHTRTMRTSNKTRDVASAAPDKATIMAVRAVVT